LRVDARPNFETQLNRLPFAVITIAGQCPVLSLCAAELMASSGTRRTGLNMLTSPETTLRMRARVVSAMVVSTLPSAATRRDSSAAMHSSEGTWVESVQHTRLRRYDKAMNSSHVMVGWLRIGCISASIGVWHKESACPDDLEAS